MTQPPTRAVDFLAHLWPLKNDRRQYMIERYFDVMRPFGIQPEQHRPVLHPPPDVSAATDKRLSQKGHRRGQLLIGLYPHADDGPRHWPLEWFVELSQRLVHDLDVQLLLLSYSRKHKIIRNIAKSVAKNITLDGLTMPELAAALTACTMLITDDAGIANLAAAVDTPVLGLGLSASVAPRGEEHIVVQSGRLASTLEEVVAAASQIVTRERSSTLFQK
jgi:ADP-heptose:LPS heptosyltransferase